MSEFASAAAPPSAPASAPVATPVPALPVERATLHDVAEISALNNLFAPDGLTLPRSEAFVANHIDDYRIVRAADGSVLGCVALDEYSPSLVELVSLAVLPRAQHRGIGKLLIEAAATLARKRGYPEVFSVSLADQLFLHMGFAHSALEHYPEKVARYAKISRSELSISRKFLFTRRLDAPAGDTPVASAA
jgi:amino-acid N-acetyltransferase